MVVFNRIINTFLIFFLAFNVLMPASYAIDCNADFINESTENTPITALFCPAFKVFNILIVSSSVVFGLYVIYSAVKLSLAWGDSKGFEGAKWSLTYAVVGFAIIMLFFVIFRVVLNTLGIEGFGSTGEITGQVESNVDVFRQLIEK